MADKIIRWGVIGSGGIARRRTIPEGIVPAENAATRRKLSNSLEFQYKKGIEAFRPQAWAPFTCT